jgi:hypothetical protein
MKSYDYIAENEDILLDLPLREGVGTITTDHAKPHHPVTFANAPTWTAEASGLGVLSFDGVNQYGQITAAKSADLDFTSGDYSIGAWFYYDTNTILSQLIAGKYELNVSGWELYTTESGSLRYLSLRHHHAGGTLTRSSAYSLGWEFLNWWFMGVSRSGADCQMYRNGAAIETVSALEDPESSAAKDVVIGTRYTKDTNFLKGKLWRPRIWSRALSADEWATIFEKERDFFGV